jgi:hypothetical protein
MWLTWKQSNSGGRRCAATYSTVFRNLLLKNEIFSGRQARQDVVFHGSGNKSVPIFRVCWRLGRTKIDDQFYAVLCPRNFHWIRLLRKLQDILLNSSSSNACKTRWTCHSHANYEEWIWTSRDEAVGMWLFERPVRSWVVLFQGIILKYIECQKHMKSSEFCVWREDLTHVLVRFRAVLL